VNDVCILLLPMLPPRYSERTPDVAGSPGAWPLPWRSAAAAATCGIDRLGAAKAKWIVSRHLGGGTRTVLTAAGVINARELKRIADEKETAKLQEVLTLRQKEEDEEKRARQDFMEREIRPDGIERFNNWVRRAAEQGRSEIEILRFPSQYLTDHGRAVNNFEAAWPETLTGAGRRVYDAYVQHLQSQGYKIRAQILNYPDGGLGEVGIFIAW
jgi:hypothetical protein